MRTRSPEQRERVASELCGVLADVELAIERWKALPPSVALRKMDAVRRLLQGQLKRSKVKRTRKE